MMTSSRYNANFRGLWYQTGPSCCGPDSPHEMARHPLLAQWVPWGRLPARLQEIIDFGRPRNSQSPGGCVLVYLQRVVYAQANAKAQLSDQQVCVPLQHSAEDSIEHYCRCSSVLQAAKDMFHLSYPWELGMNLRVLNSALLNNPSNLMNIAILISCVCNAFNSLRYSLVDSSQQGFHCASISTASKEFPDIVLPLSI